MGRPGIADIGPADQALFEDDQALLETDTHAAFPDMDAGPTKAWLVRHRGTAEWRWLFDYAFAPRPEEELYDLQTDPDQMNNLVSDPAYADVRRELAERLMSVLRDEGDPRLADDVPFEKSPFTDVER
jgi:uncharacterized sulfatase